VYENPCYMKKSSRRLKRLQRSYSKKQKGGKNREKSRHKLAKQHLKVHNQREDKLHCISIELIRENKTIVLEDLNVAGMMKNRKLSKAIHDVGMGRFRQ